MVTVSFELASCTGPAVEPLEGNYFVAAYPPFSCWRQERVEALYTLLGCPAPQAGGAPFGLYVHIPFCAQRCQYCYYLSYADRTLRYLDRYLDALLRELALYGGMPAFAGRRVGCVYFGGGTPSLLPAESIGRLMNGLKAVFPWTSVEEVTFECAPRSVTRHKLEELRRAGVNRISLGVQQLADEVLRLNGRIHLVADVHRAWEEIQAVGFPEVNVDLIAGLVGQTDTSFGESLEDVLRMGPDSVTIYQLEIPQNTPLYRSLKDGTVLGGVPTWPTKRARLAFAFSRLEEAGYVLRSAYAAARSTRHRRFVYQEEQYRGADLVGIGASSISYIAGAHYQNLATLESYLASLRDDRLPIGRAYLLSEEEQLVREFVLQLKLGRVEAGYFHDKFGVAIGERFAEPLAHCAGQGLLTFDERGVTLTRDGLLQVDRLLPSFYLPMHRGLRYS
jgi:oxygen-independent coproporphyrinogen-3 oxidase